MKAGTVLVVEDDPDICALLKELLIGEGYHVQSAANGADAINLLEESEAPCVVLVDLLMPGIVGQEVLEYLRSEERLSSVPVAVVSGSPQLAPEGYQVFTKPVDVESLLAFVRQGCQISRAFWRRDTQPEA